MHTPKIKRAALYLRVSTIKQDNDSQEQECTMYAQREALPIARCYRDTVSGSIPWRARQLGTIIKEVPDLTDIIIYEYSRIGRDMVDALDFLKHCNEEGITVHITKSRQVVRADIGGKVISTVMALASEIERDMLRSRTKDALTERKRKIKENGGFTSKAGNYITKLGRPSGSTSGSKLDGQGESLDKLISNKVSDAAISRIFNCDPRTVKAYRMAIYKGPK